MLKILSMLPFVANLFMTVSCTSKEPVPPCETRPVPRCETNVCGPNERWEVCPIDICQPKTCAELGYPISCPGRTLDGSCPVKAGCICKDGLVRDDKGVCIKKKQCPSCGGDPKAESGYGNNCGRTCSNYNVTCPPECPQIYEFNGCDCKPGYVLDEFLNICVSPEDCTPKCGPNEEPNSCVNGGCYTARTCDDLDRGSKDICVDPYKCEAGCLCKAGFLRNREGKCVPENKCPNNKCKNLNERFYECPDKECRPKECTDVGFPVACPEPDGVCPGKPGCLCIEGHVRNAKGICVPLHNCPSCGGDRNATSGCGVNCGRTCSTYNKEPQFCILICYDNACDCKEVYVYDEVRQKCVLPKDCAPPCGQNEEPNSCVNGGCYNARTCEDLDRPGTLCVDPIKCEAGCLCKPGYLRNSITGKCIPETQCPNNKCKKVHERYYQCPDNECRPKNCTEVGFPLACPDLPQSGKCPGKPGCLCMDGYARNSQGVCVPTDKCPACGGDPHATTGCGINCGRHCSNYNKGPVACIDMCMLNACDCKEGYVFDDNLGKCVRPEDCTPTCGPDEQFDGCVNGGCYSARNCTDLVKLDGNIICVDPAKCQPGCLCKVGYLRDSRTGKCVPEYMCPHSKCKKANETYFHNPSSLCSPQTCSQLGFPQPCLGPSSGPDKPACLCIPGYLRDHNGVCVPDDQCPSCGGDVNAKRGCGIHCGNKCSDYNKPPQPCPAICGLNACDCKDGYVFDDNKRKCVLPQNCSPTCGPNEEPSGCVNGGCHGARTCDDLDTLGSGIICVDLIPGACKAGCLCKKGYLRTKEGICVPEYECPNTPKCGSNEEPNGCINGGCHGARTCDELDTLGGGKICVDPIPGACKAGCLCKKGYLRTKEGICVLENKCPNNKCKKPNESYNKCPDMLCRPQNCTEVGYPVACPLPSQNGTCPGKPGCVCKEGYARNEQGVCVPVTSCPSCGGDPNSVSGCSVNCGRLCSNYKSKEPVVCTKLCLVNACECKADYVFDSNLQRCVLPHHCTPTCSANEEFNNCVNGVCDRKTCSDLDRTSDPECPSPPVCRAGCLCKPGYLKNDLGVCIPENTCPNSKCKRANETYVQDPSSQCAPQTCNDVGFPLACFQPDAKPQKPACLCTTGLVKNSEGVCVPPSQCPSCGGDPNATTGCSNYCGNRCSTYKKGPVACPLFCIFNGCDCKAGYVYDDNLKKCVLSKDCTQTCGQNEVYNECTNGGCFGAKNCTEKGAPTKCVKLDPKYCKKGCICQEGYLRNQNGICVLEDECQLNKQCKGPYSYYDNCGSNCSKLQQTCAYLKNQTICPSETADCKPMCRCLDGYYTNAAGICVAQSDCSKPENQCKANQEYVICPGVCPVRKCGINDKGIFCPRQPVPGDPNCPPPACKCKAGFYLNDKGDCVTLDQCPKCKKNEIYDTCYWKCPPRTCGINDAAVLCAPVDPKNCTGACRCQDGYQRNNKGECVTPDQCPTQPICKKNEVYVECPARCPPRVCGIDDRLVDSAPQPVKGDPKCPPPACRCHNGYYRNDKGACVKWEQCPICTNPNEEYDPCIRPCPPRLCSVDDRLIRCAAPPQLGDPNCQAGCRCKDGYARTNDGVCVLRDQCPTCTRPNEEYVTCPNSCDPQTCESIGKKFNCPIQIDGKPKCKPACRCKTGYFRNKLGDCISKENCLKCSGPNEFYSCGGACDNVCATLSQQNQTSCPIINIKCNEMCYCDEGYARNASNICIPIKNCPATTCPKGMKMGCGNNCNRMCFNKFNGRSKFCPRYVCTPENSSCQCDPDQGYWYDPIKKKCVPGSECPKPQCTGPNEIYDTCPKSTCPPQTCDSIGKIYHCPAELIPPVCNPACRCEVGYLRNSSGTCIPEIQCPPTCGQNEELSNCTEAVCRIQDCSQKGNPISCAAVVPTICSQGCLCKENFLRNSQGLCVPEDQCPNECTGPNEIYDTCPKSTCPPQTCDSIGKSYSCPAELIPPVCNPACRCEEGYLRNSSGICIPEIQCPPTCGQNEELSNCTEAVCRIQDCSQKGNPIACAAVVPTICTQGCLCKENYLRNSQGLCVPEDQCPIVCTGPNEYYDKCPNSTCPPQTCDSIGQIYSCPAQLIPPVCNPACRCQAGYLRNSSGICIPEIQCQCTGPNEFYDTCPKSICPPQTCDSIGQTYFCPAILNPPVCNPACRCEDGYLRNSSEICIPEIQCPTTCPTGMKMGCGNNCNRMCINKFNGPSIACPRPACTPVTSSCQCDPDQDFWYDPDKEMCVPGSQCPEPQCPGPNELYDKCPPQTCAPQTCDSIGKIYNCPLEPAAGATVCKPACRCEDGYLRNSSRTCIPEIQCPTTCPIGMKMGCGNNCNRMCSNKFNGPSPLCANIECTSEISSCQCDPDQDYWFNPDTQTCVPGSECPKPPTVLCNGDPNAVSGCGTNCGRLCSNYNSSVIVDCPDFCLLDGCDCKPDYVLNEGTGKCVLPKDCPKPKPTCGFNEVYSNCTNGGCFGAKNCTEKGAPVKCVKLDAKSCKKGCICKPGFLRNQNGICVPENQCELNKICNGPYTFYDDCGSNCKLLTQTCASLQNATVCPPETAVCKPMCRCIDGYYTNAAGKCVSQSDCSKPENQCKANSEYELCPGICPARKCGINDTLVFCPRNPVLGEPGCPPPACRCLSGFYMNDQGDCVTLDKCPKCTKPNEEYVACPDSCDPQTCESIGKVFGCPLKPVGKPTCKGACRCKSGFYRNKLGDCISKANCLKCSGPNEYYSCGGACDNVCATLSQQNQTSCPIINIKCNEMCYCYEGYARNASGICVPFKNCPKCTGPNECYDTCPKQTCAPQTCDSVGNIYNCLEQPSTVCKPACRCNDGYLRNSTGICIPQKECPCNGDPNSVPGCGMNCGRYCSNYKNSAGAVGCAQVCKVGGCDCKPGYVVNDITGKCVLPKDCPTECSGPNTTYDDCGSNCKLMKQTCAYIKKPTDCPIETAVCKPMCLCKAGFYKNSKSVCVSKCQCD